MEPIKWQIKSNKSLKPCETPEEIAMLKKETHHLQTMTENEVYKETGCLSACEKTEFDFPGASN